MNTIVSIFLVDLYLYTLDIYLWLSKMDQNDLIAKVPQTKKLLQNLQRKNCFKRTTLTELLLFEKLLYEYLVALFVAIKLSMLA